MAYINNLASRDNVKFIILLILSAAFLVIYYIYDRKLQDGKVYECCNNLFLIYLIGGGFIFTIILDTFCHDEFQFYEIKK
jgi:drug/metabolite transporter (DMT)-like permease